jgi:hypothetical protein
MRLFLALVIILLAAAVFAYPPLLENSDGECSALEELVAHPASHDGSGRLAVGALYGSSSSSPSGAAFATDRYPALPVEVGCALAYWKIVFDPPIPAPAAAQAEPAEPSPAGDNARPSGAVASIVARSITPNGDPISPAAIFTLPMESVAIRVDYPGSANAVRFRLLQGRAVIASCDGQKGAAGTAWCKFDVSLRKGVYSIAVSANDAPLGQFPFTVIGR